MKTIKTALCLLLAAFSFNALANPEVIKKEFEKKYTEVKVDRVTKAGYGDLWEIYAGGEIIYTDEKVSYLIIGTLVDVASKQNVTEARLQKLTAIKFADLPFEHSIKLVRGNGARKMAIFEDPNCGYCKKFEQDVNSLDNITAYIFPYPILAQDSTDKSKAVWCSPDRLKAWQDLMLRERQPTAKGTCENPIDKIVAVGRSLRITGTPTTFFEDGERIAGILPKDKMEAKLVSAKAAAANVADARK